MLPITRWHVVFAALYLGFVGFLQSIAYILQAKLQPLQATTPRPRMPLKRRQLSEDSVTSMASSECSDSSADESQEEPASPLCQSPTESLGTLASLSRTSSQNSEASASTSKFYKLLSRSRHCPTSRSCSSHSARRASIAPVPARPLRVSKAALRHQRSLSEASLKGIDYSGKSSLRLEDLL
jgi:hypothetical protein